MPTAVPSSLSIPQRPPGVTQPVQTRRPPDSVKMAAFITAIYIFILNSRISEVLHLHSIKLPAVLMTVALVASAFTYMSGRIVLGRLVNLYGALTVIFILSSILSVWVGGSLDALFNGWLRSFALVFAIVCTVSTLKETILVTKAAMLGFAFLAVYTLLAGGRADGRMGGATSVGDPNYIAMSMLYAMPLALYFTRHGSALLRLISLGSVVTMAAMFALSGSRGGIIGLAFVVVVWLFTASMRARLMLVMGLLVAIAVAAVTVPKAILERYTTMGADKGTSAETTSAIESTQARQYLFWRSVELTLKHPVLGVGHGMFAIAENEQAKSNGLRKGAWHETHNSYTQISSENGVVALILYVWILVITIRNLNGVCRIPAAGKSPEIVQALDLAHLLRLSVIGVAAAGMFLSIGYAGYIPVLAPISMLLYRIVLTEHNRTQLPSFAPRVAPRRIVLQSMA